jgi:hypothetical protein
LTARSSLWAEKAGRPFSYFKGKTWDRSGHQ